jgi:hypothetical protein
MNLPSTDEFDVPKVSSSLWLLIGNAHPSAAHAKVPSELPYFWWRGGFHESRLQGVYFQPVRGLDEETGDAADEWVTVLPNLSIYKDAKGADTLLF